MNRNSYEFSGPRARATAETRARGALRAWLTPEQNAELDAHGGFALTAGNGRRYVVVATAGGELVHDPERQIAYGWYPAEVMPPSDMLLATVLALASPGGAQDMTAEGCRFPRGVTSAHRQSWAVVDRVLGLPPVPW